MQIIVLSFLTLLIVLSVVVVILVGLAERRFSDTIMEEANQVALQAGEDPAPAMEPAAAESLPADESLPAPLARYLALVIPAGAPPVRFVRLEHGGDFRTGEGGGWTPMRGVQWYRAMQPAFVWSAWLRNGPLLWVRAREAYLDGEGRMDARLLSVFSVARGSGPETDVNMLIRYAAELPLLPGALRPSTFVQWQPLNADSALMTVRDGRYAVQLRFYFGEQGLVQRVESDERYRSVADGFVRTPWVQYYEAYRSLGGVQVPGLLRTAWRLPQGEVEYARFEIEQVVYQ